MRSILAYGAPPVNCPHGIAYPKFCKECFDMKEDTRAASMPCRNCGHSKASHSPDNYAESCDKLGCKCDAFEFRRCADCNAREYPHALRHIFLPARETIVELSQVLQPDGVKETEGKDAMSFLLSHYLAPFYPLLREVVKGLEVGAKEHKETDPADPNWKRVEPAEKYLDAAMRHARAHLAGTKLDAKSGIHHVSAVVIDVMIWAAKIRGR